MFIAERIISVIAPHLCLGCSAEGAVLCNWCRHDFLSPLPSRCYSCHKLTSDFAVCVSCKKSTSLSHVWIVTAYDASAKRLVEFLKFQRGRAASGTIAELLNDALPALEGQVIVSHIPTATTRRRQRGYDQSELIAKKLARHKGLRHEVFLARNGQTRQVGASKAQRKKQMKEAFRPLHQHKLKGRTVLLIDDLTTTGATIEAAAKVLKKAGAKKVFAATLAQRV